MYINGTVDTGRYVNGNVSSVSNSLKEEIIKNTESRHTHDNKKVLDGISESDVRRWNSGTGGGGTGGESIYITDVEESTEDSGINTITFSDGKSVEIRNGSKGSDGEKGEQGIQGIQGETGAKGDKGDKGEKGDVGANGADGKDGVSATHSWDGTVLTVTSASGTSSADLKGDKGDKGENSENALELWQPNTAYAVGDMVLGLTLSDTYNIIVCKTAHTSINDKYYESGDDDKWKVVLLDEVKRANTAINALCDSAGNDIENTYETKENVQFLANEHYALEERVNNLNINIPIDDTPTEGSTNAVSSGGVYRAIGDIETALDNIIAIQESLIGGETA